MKGDGVYNNSGANQQAKLKLVGRKTGKVFFAIENDGTVRDRVQIRSKGGGRDLKEKYFRIDGGRRNITGNVLRSGYTQLDIYPGETVRFQGKIKYRITDRRKRKKVRLSTDSLQPGAPGDTVRVKVIPRK